MFDIDQLVADCQDAAAETEPRRAVREVLQRSVARGDEVAAVLQPGEGGLQLLYVSPELTVLHVVWAPGMRLYPHDHRMWAAIGIYTGGEDNAFYRRAPEGLTESGGRSLRQGDACLLGDDTVHAVTNPTTQFTGAIHIYGGDFFATPRSEWDESTREERPYDVERTLRYFEEQNARFIHDQS